MKIVTWNIEWMNRLFVNNRPKEDAVSLDRFNHIKMVINNLDPGVLSIQEGATEYEEMTSFIDTYLDGNYECVRAPKRDFDPVTGRRYSDTQLIWILYKRDLDFSHVEVVNSEYNGPFQDWKATIDPNLGGETFFHHRIPGEIDLHYAGSEGMGPIKFFAFHPKSKKSPNIPEIMAENRRKLLAQGINARNWIDYLLDNDPDRYIVALGDMNDGIGLDRFEYRLGGDFASIITGDVRKPHKLFTNSLEKEILDNLEEPGRHYTLKFGETPREKIIVDYILFSPSFNTEEGISCIKGSGKIRYDVIQQYPKASDHMPVEAMIRIS